MSGLVRLSGDDPRWLRFAASRPESTPFHHPSWLSTIVDTYGFSSFVAALETTDGELEAGIPVVEKRALASRRHRWLSLPYTDRCRPLGREAAVADLLNLADDARRHESVAGLEVRSTVPVGGTLHQVERGWVHELDLRDHGTPDELYSTLSKSRVHRGIKRARSAGVVVRRSAERDDLVSLFYRLHLLTRRKQGVPIQPRRFFECLWERMFTVGLGCTYVAELDGVPLAAAVFLRWNRTLVYKFGASDPARLDLRPNHALFWRAIEAAFEDGDSRVDFGRTDADNAGLRAFKSQWGAEETPLVYATSDTAPTARTLAPRVSRRVIQVAPSWVCRVLGERLYRYAS